MFALLRLPQNAEVRFDGEFHLLGAARVSEACLSASSGQRAGPLSARARDQHCPGPPCGLAAGACWTPVQVSSGAYGPRQQLVTAGPLPPSLGASDVPRAELALSTEGRGELGGRRGQNRW